MAITNAQQYQQLVNKPANGKRPGYRGSSYGPPSRSSSQGPAGGASSGGNYGGNRQSGSNFGSGNNTPSPGGNRNNNNNNNNNNNIDYDYSYTGPGITDADAERILKARPDLQEGIANAKIYKANEEKRKKEQEEEDEKRRKEEEKKAKKETRDQRKKETAKQKKTRRMQKAAFDRFQRLDKYVDPLGDYTTFADMSGEDAARLAGYNVNEFGPPGQIEFEYDKDRFRDPVTGKIKSELTEMVDINKGKTDIFGNPKKPKMVEQIRPDAIPGYDFSINPVKSNFQSGLGTLTSTGSTTKVRPNDYGLGDDSKFPSALKVIGDIMRPETGLQAFNTLEEARNVQDFAGRFQGGDDSAYEEFEDYVSRNTPTSMGGGDSDNQTDPCKGPNPPAYCAVNNDPADPATPTRNFGGLAPRFAGSIFDFTGLANGGRAGYMDGGMMEDTPEGGIMDLESGRQMYFLGKLVKKATRAVKKVAKSPFGKAALSAALFKFGGGFGGGKGLAGLKSTLFGQAASQAAGPMKYLQGTPFTKGLFGKLGLTTGGGSMMPTLKGGLTLGLGIPFALDALGVGKEEDGFDIDEYYRTGGINIADIRNNPYNYLSARNQGSLYAADGGLMRTGYQEGGDAEPVAKKTMPLLDMDGMEKDYRAEGGFVPIGRMERADDVPARLSKNEFVFTADAVRNAGEGDIDKGAEVMYNMMKNLESGGEVSEESQGLNGAREMFKTSQRLEEVL